MAKPHEEAERVKSMKNIKIMKSRHPAKVWQSPCAQASLLVLQPMQQLRAA